MLSSASLDSTSPISESWFNKTNIEKQDVAALLQTAGLMLESPDISTTASSSQSSLNHENTQHSTQQEALSVFNHWILQCQNAKLLQASSALLYASLSHLAEAEQVEKCMLLNPSAMIKLCAVNPDLEKIYVPMALKSLSTEQLQWLFVVLKSNMYVSKVGNAEHVVSAPKPDAALAENCLQLLALAQAGSEHQSLILEAISYQLHVRTVSDNDVVAQAESLAELVQEAQIQNKLYPFAMANTFWARGYANTLNHALNSFDNNQLGWMLVALATGNANYNGYTPQQSEYAELSKLVKSYGRDYVIQSLEQLLHKRGQQAPIDAVTAFLEESVKALDANTQKWLLLELVFKNFPHIPETGITPPTGEQCQRAEKLRDNVYNCTKLWSSLQEMLLDTLDKEVEKIVPFIPGLIFSLANQIPDEARLWLYLAIATNTKANLFDIHSNYYHEQASDTTIQQMLVSDITDHFMFLARCNPMMRTLMKTALTQKSEPDPAFSKRVSSLIHYEKHFVEKELNKLDDNARLWLLYAACFNVQTATKTQIAPQIYISPPPRRIFDQANIMLDQMYASPEVRKHYVQALSSRLNPEQRQGFELLIDNYLQTALNGLNKDEQAWLFLSLSTGQFEAHAVDFNYEFGMPKDKMPSIAKIIYLVSQFPEKRNLITQSLIEKNGMLAYFAPTLLETAGSMTQQRLAPGEMANLTGLDERQSKKLAFELLQQIPEPMKAWLGVSLQSGEIDTTQLLMLMLQLQIPPQLFMPLLKPMSTMLLLCMKYPELRALTVKHCHSNPEEIKPFSLLKLDMLPLGDIGFAMLCESLLPQAQHLCALSVMHTGLTDHAVLTFNQTLFSNAPLQALALSNIDINATGYEILFNNPQTRQDPILLSTAVTALLGEIQSPDIKGYLAARLVAPSLLDKILTEREINSFYKLDDQAREIAMADMLVQRSGEDFMVQSMLGGYLDAISPTLANNQLIHLALSSRNPNILEPILHYVVENVQNIQLTQWVLNVLETGVIRAPKIGSDAFTDLFGKPAKQGDVLQMMQLSALLLSLNQELRLTLYQSLNGTAKLLPAVTEVDLSYYQVPESLQTLIQLGIDANPQALTSLTLKAVDLSAPVFQRVCESMMQKPTLASLDLGESTFKNEHIHALSSCIKSSSIKSLNLADCSFTKPQFDQLLAGVGQSQLTTLNLSIEPSSPEQSDSDKSKAAPANQKTLTNAMIKSIADLLEKPNCPLEQLDLSHQNISSLGLKYLLHALQKNPNSRLVSLKLDSQDNHAELKDKIQALLLQHQVKKPSLAALEEINSASSSQADPIPALTQGMKQLRFSQSPSRSSSPDRSKAFAASDSVSQVQKSPQNRFY